ncbi:MAG: hypothetical protein U1F76_19985 [Candidatus Competibacteraceae bacterium]
MDQVVVDGVGYAVDFQGFDVPLEIVAPSGFKARLLPWRYQAHIEALRACVLPDKGGLRLDRETLAQRVLDRSGIPPTLHTELVPLALWWAAGGGETAAVTVDEEWYTLGPVRVRLRPWSSGECFAALAANLQQNESGMVLDMAGYLDAMIKASVLAIDPPVALTELSAASTLALLDSVIALNVVPVGAVEQSVMASPQAAQITLRLCRALGWTPSQVWATPASEVDRLLALLERVEGTPPPASKPQGLAAYPDAVVIQIEDD